MVSFPTLAVFVDRVVRPIMPPRAAWVVCAFLCFVAGGCAGGEPTHLRNAEEFQQVLAQDDKPVLVDFYKGGCPTCIPMDGLMDKLAREYKDRVVVAKFMLVEPYFAVTSPELKERYAISYFPTVILFVHGRETWRFLRDYELDDYRKALDKALLGPSTQGRVLPPGETSGE